MTEKAVSKLTPRVSPWAVLGPSVAVNLPLLAVLWVHRGNEHLVSMMMHYPGQSLWCLFIFPFGWWATLACLRNLRAALREEKKEHPGGTGPLARVWPGALRPTMPLLLVALAFGLVCALLSYSADRPTLYALEPEKADAATAALTKATANLQQLRSDSQWDGVLWFVQDSVRAGSIPARKPRIEDYLPAGEGSKATRNAGVAAASAAVEVFGTLVAAHRPAAGERGVPATSGSLR